MQTGINGILDRIAAMAKQETFSSIEKDLLLQYTRELYEHILNTETRLIVSQVPEPDTANSAPLPDATELLAPGEEVANQKIEHPHDDHRQMEESEDKTTPNNAKEAFTGTDSEIIEDQVASDVAETPAVIETPEANEEESADSILADSAYLVETELAEEDAKFVPEAPEPEEEKNEEPEEEPETSEAEEALLLIATEKPFQEPEDFELEPELKNEQVFDPKNLIDFRLWNRDIRSYIGINDKYNFISELFSNNAEAYEEILNEINGMESAEEARYFLENSGVTTLYKWQEEGFSEQIFYNVLNQFFAAK